MNTQLEKLLEKHNFSQKDRYEFLQIYSLLPANKMVMVIENFEEIVSQIDGLKQDLQEEQSILL